MSLIFPRDMTTPNVWEQLDLTLQRRQEISRTAGGMTTMKDLGPALWRASCQSIPLPRRKAMALRADLETLGGGVRTFYLVPYPEFQPAARNGEALDGVTVESIGENFDTIALVGLPAGFVMTESDYLSISTSTGTEFHQLARGGTADGTGVTPEMEVTHHIRPSVSVSDAVRLVEPRLEMHLAPGSLEFRQVGAQRATVGFESMQVIR